MPVRGWWVIGWVLLLGMGGLARAQVVRPGGDPYAHADTLDLREPEPFQLRPNVVAGSEEVYVGRTQLDPTGYRLDAPTGRLWLEQTTFPPRARLVVRYRTWPFAWPDAYARRAAVGPDSVRSDGASDSLTAAAVVAVPQDPNERDPFGNVRLQRSGAITRGILAGSARDVSVESGLRMQLAGEVVEGVEVQAVLTDENTPIQPDGTTQRLSDFDRVYIRLQHENGLAQLGDVDLALGGTEFARLTRKIQGATLQAQSGALRPGAFSGLRTTFVGATSRGLFRSQEIQPIDGVQGPYRLEGASGEQFIIVEAGSETVYLDGQPQVLGEGNDYVVDYQTGEVTFTANEIITADRRIVVEFQYRTNEFDRALVGSQAEAFFWGRPDGGDPRVRVGATVIREADSRQLSAELGFTPADSLVIAAAGDGRAARSGAERLERFDPEAGFVQYVLVREDPLPGGGTVPVFEPVQAAPPDSVAVYRVRFTRIGTGEGSYVRGARDVNGLVFEYRGPGRGDYAPIRLLPKPKQQRLVDLHGAVAVRPGVEVFGEWARSLNDQNRLSAAGGTDDVGNGFVGGLRLDALPLGRLGVLAGLVRRRFTSAHFATFDRTRPVEFDRRWNLVATPISATGGVAGAGDETIDEAELRWAVTPQSFVGAELGRLDLGPRFQGRRAGASLGVEEAGWPRLAYVGEWVSTDDALSAADTLGLGFGGGEPVARAGRWARQEAAVGYGLLGGRLVPSVEVEQERREQAAAGADSLLGRSYAWTEWRPGVAWRAEALEVGAQWAYQTRDEAAAGVLQDAATAWTLQSDIAYRPSSSFSANADLGYRVRRFTDLFRTTQGAEDTESIVSRLDARWTPWERALSLNVLYEALSERTPVQQEVYVLVGPEIGEWVWVDAEVIEDGEVVRPLDGVIQLDEFLPERTPNEGTYYKTTVPSDSLQAVVSVQARVRLDLDPARIWRDAEGGPARWLRHVSTRTTAEVLEKSRDPEIAQIYLLNLRRFRDPLTTLTGSLRLSQDVYLFRGLPRGGLDLHASTVRNLTELASGEEERLLTTRRARGRGRITEELSASVGVVSQHNRTRSAFANRRFDITSVELEPELTWNATRNLQLTAGAAYARKRDAVREQRARLLKLPAQARLSRATKLSLTVRAEVARIQLTGGDRASGLAQYELTDGRGPGTSYLWGVNGSYRLNSYLTATLAYDGRAPGDAPVLHTLRMQLSALF